MYMQARGHIVHIKQHLLKISHCPYRQPTQTQSYCNKGMHNWGAVPLESPLKKEGP